LIASTTALSKPNHLKLTTRKKRLVYTFKVCIND